MGVFSKCLSHFETDATYYQNEVQCLKLQKMLIQDFYIPCDENICYQSDSLIFAKRPHSPILS